MNDQIRIMVKEPEKEPFFMAVENTLKSLQTIVNGYIEVVPVSDRIAIVCNENGRLTEKQNCVINGIMHYGTVIWIGLNSAGDELCTLY